MTEEERGLVMALVTQGLPHSEFLKRFRGSTNGQRLCGELLVEARNSKVADDVAYAMLVGSRFGFNPEHFESLLHLVSEPWHRTHEDVVTALGQFKTPKAVEALYAATQWIPEYLDFDESRALAVKAIWALGAIAGPQAEEALLKLTSDKDPILSQNATEQLQRRHAQ